MNADKNSCLSAFIRVHRRLDLFGDTYSPQTMAVLFIKEFPDDLQQKLKDIARQHRRSMAKEALMLLEEALDRVAPTQLSKGFLSPSKAGSL
jgi:hypothetical protein